jgi:hypothetical protein
MSDIVAVEAGIGVLASLFLIFAVANYGVPGRRAMAIVLLSVFGLASLALVIHAAVAVMQGRT